MAEKLDIDKLLNVYCEGIYAMDPKTALPFWDYDFGPIYGDLWINKMLEAISRAKKLKLSYQQINGYFKNIAVPRKELIYSLVDLKVGKIPFDKRMEFVDFWWNVINQTCVKDCLVEKANIIHSREQIGKMITDIPWQKADLINARQIGNLAMNLNSLSYGLYTDIFAHNAMENFGAYDVSKYFGNKKHILVVKQWVNLKPIELWSEFNNFKFDNIKVYAIYKDIDFTVDIYTHQTYSGSAASNLAQYCVLANDGKVFNDAARLEKINNYLGKTVVNHFTKVQNRGFEEAKKMWVLARNYQFIDFFKAVGLEWRDWQMLDRVKNKPLIKTDFWDFDKYPKEILFEFWKKCFDPRLDTYFDDWAKILKQIINERKK